MPSSHLSGESSEGASETSSDHGETSNQMMSIFASYYGIESTEVAPIAKGTIDDANFDSDSYVRGLLKNESVEGLISKDTEMVHEIRSLDGEMQKLVYDNYNKFITATETIKEMKTDVYGMDPDMDSVRQKMTEIANSSRSLDEKLHVKRNQVDKLVRIRRLLQRLEFLGELPERLSSLIERKLYEEAVQLYRKTISVLTRHSHVLSFKNIKERTEQMMVELTGKVADLLDDSSLEAVKLTQYVVILRMMDAPRKTVEKKVLIAHKTRSLRMISEFAQRLTQQKNSNNTSSIISIDSSIPGTPLSARSDIQWATKIQPVSPQSEANAFIQENLSDIAAARQFHQSLVVGLIEACKGISELYKVNTTQEVGFKSPYTSTMSEDPVAREKDLREACKVLQETISLVMSTYTEVLVSAFSEFFNRFQNHFYSLPASQILDPLWDEELSEGVKKDFLAAEKRLRSNSTINDEGKNERVSESTLGSVPESGDLSMGKKALDEIDEETNEIETKEKKESIQKEEENQQLLDSEEEQVMKFKTFELHEERSSWVLLARQAIMDILYLDKAQDDCYARLANRKKSDKGKPHGSQFAKSLLKVLNEHCESLLKYRLHCLMNNSIKDEWLPRIVTLCDIKGSLTGLKENSEGKRNQKEAREILQKHISLLQNLLGLLHHLVVQIFNATIKDIKPIVDIAEIADLGKTSSSIAVGIIANFILNLSQEIENLTHIVTAKTSFDPENMVLIHNSEDLGKEQEVAEEDREEIFVELNHNTSISENSESTVESGLLLFLSALLRSFLPRTLIQEMMDKLKEMDLPVLLPSHEQLKNQCAARLELTTHLLLKTFLETNARMSCNLFAEVQFYTFSQNYSKVIDSVGETVNDPTEIKEVEVEDGVLRVVSLWDNLAVMCCMMLSEAPPPPKMGDRALRRGSTMNNNYGSTAVSNANLQQDIDRLFSKKIQVFEVNHATISSTVIQMEFLLNTIMKATLKSSLERVRNFTLPFEAYLHLQAQTTFLKQTASCLLRDSSDCDGLCSQVLNALFSRYTGANDISSASDSYELSLVARGVNSAFTKCSDFCVLLGGSDK